jgi:hypothetical protein
MKVCVSTLGICATLGLSLAMPIDADAQHWRMDVAQGIQLPIPDFKPVPESQLREKKKELDETRFNRPIYNPGTKSYFEYVINIGGKEYGGSRGVGWEQAKSYAETKTFHGVRGRLAVIKNKEANDFIVKHFKPEDGTWIGLRYFCDLHALQWVTGEIWPLTAYANWGRPWNVEGTKSTNVVRSSCLKFAPWMGVHYWGAETGYKWNANGTGKYFEYMIIEYPTGKP